MAAWMNATFSGSSEAPDDVEAAAEGTALLMLKVMLYKSDRKPAAQIYAFKRREERRDGCKWERKIPSLPEVSESGG